MMLASLVESGVDPSYQGIFSHLDSKLSFLHEIGSTDLLEVRIIK